MMLYFKVKVRHYCDMANEIVDTFINITALPHETWNDITPTIGCALECECGDEFPTFLMSHNGMIPIHQYPDAELGDVVEWASW